MKTSTGTNEMHHSSQPIIVFSYLLKKILILTFLTQPLLNISLTIRFYPNPTLAALSVYLQFKIFLLHQLSDTGVLLSKYIYPQSEAFWGGISHKYNVVKQSTLVARNIFLLCINNLLCVMFLRPTSSRSNRRKYWKLPLCPCFICVTQF